MYNKTLNEGLNHKDMEGLIKQTVHIDEFESKMGSEDEICVISFYVRNNKVANDLIDWFEKGYDFILDADRSPGEIKPNRFLVFIEVKRRSFVPAWLEELLNDLGTLCEYEKPEDWIISYKDKEFIFNKEQLKKTLILSPKDYREAKELELNEMREQAGLPTKRIYENDKDIKAFKAIAGL